MFFGLAQVASGLALGVVNNYRKRNYKHAVAKFASITTIIFGVLAIARALRSQHVPAHARLRAARPSPLIVTVALSGQEAIEVVSLIGHPLSYARIMGFGLASVIIALLIDKAFTPSPSQGIVVFVLYAALFIVLHILNMIMSMFEGIVQGVRLNFIEFFSKFYVGRGEVQALLLQEEVHRGGETHRRSR